MASAPTAPLLTLTINNDLVLFQDVPFTNVHFPRTPADLFILALCVPMSVPETTWATLGKLWCTQDKTRWQCRITTEPDTVYADGYLTELLLRNDPMAPRLRLIIAGSPQDWLPVESTTR